MSVRAANKSSLRDIYQEIDLYDRKIAHHHKFEKFDSDDEKNKALDRMTTQREKLIKAAKEMVASGVEVDEKDLPRSFRTNVAEPPPDRTATSNEEQKIEAPQTAFGKSVSDAEAVQRTESQP